MVRRDVTALSADRAHDIDAWQWWTKDGQWSTAGAAMKCRSRRLPPKMGKAPLLDPILPHKPD
ncbi:hypothetical protein [Alteriqipengyuania sp. 357]